MSHIINHYKIANQNHKITLHMHLGGENQKKKKKKEKQTITSVDKKGEKWTPHTSLVDCKKSGATALENCLGAVP